MSKKFLIAVNGDEGREIYAKHSSFDFMRQVSLDDEVDAETYLFDTIEEARKALPDAQDEWSAERIDGDRVCQIFSREATEQLVS